MDNISQIPLPKKRKKCKNKKKKSGLKSPTINNIPRQETLAVSSALIYTKDPGPSEIWRLTNSQPWPLPHETIANSQGHQNDSQTTQLHREENPNQAGPSGISNNSRKRHHCRSETESQPNKVPKTSSYNNEDNEALYCTLHGSDRPSRIGLRNKTHPVDPVYNIYASSVEESLSWSPKTPPLNGQHFNHEEVPSTSHAGFRNVKKDVVYIIDSDSDDSVHYVPMEKRKEEIVDLDEDDEDDPIYVGIRNVTPMTKNQMILVNRAMNNAIIGIGVKGAGPRFSNNSHKAGWILITCEDHKSRIWLETEVPRLNPWPGAQLSIIPYNELQKPVLASVFVPKKEGVLVPQALELLRVQNEGLETEYWKIVDGFKSPTGQAVLLSIDRHSYDALKALNFVANLGASKVKFNFGTNLKDLSMSSDAGYSS